jgi:YD repeat-containing protein
MRGYHPNTDAYLVGFPAFESLYEGIGIGGALREHKQFLYDNHSSFSEPPNAGLVTRTRRWNDRDGSWIETNTAYDDAGNTILEVDERGNATSFEYDATFQIYETERCNALGQCLTRAYDTVIGRVISETDPNGATTSYVHDALRRQLEIHHPDDTTTSFEYLDLGDPNAQRIRKHEPDGTADGLWSEVYQDGLGREYKTVREGSFTKEVLFSDTSTRKWKESLWYAEGEDPQYRVLAYDGAQRVRTETLPDGTVSEIAYGIGFQVLIDELGNEKTIWKDPYGRVT